MDLQQYLENTFKTLGTAVVVCRAVEGYPVVYANPAMQVLTNPHMNIERIKRDRVAEHLDTLFRFEDKTVQESFFASLSTLGTVSNFLTEILNYENARVAVNINANFVDFGGESLCVIYTALKNDNMTEDEMHDSVLSSAFHLANHCENVEAGINSILALIGSYAGVSRVYIFEEVSPTMTSNTYEWCAEGVSPAIQGLKNMKKTDYNYDVIVRGGLYIADDIHDLPPNDFAIVDAQGIKSIAIVPLFNGQKPLGYVGFDDCSKYRKWSTADIRLLNEISSIIVSLLLRRNSEAVSNRSLQILQTISDNIDNIVYVTDITTDELIFANKALAAAFNVDTGGVVGNLCWKMLQRGQTGRCSNCPLNKMLDSEGNVVKQTYIWENLNPVTNKWYLIRDTLIEWIDGRMVHMETATEITHQKAYEAELMHSASVDSMTGAYNREWGYKIMQDMRTDSDDGGDVSLVFIDLDNLKLVNDKYGHDTGDDKITKTVDAIRASVRQSDVLIRWGGDEFILLLLCPPETAARIMKNIENKLKGVVAEEGLPYSLDVSYGITKLNVDSLVPLDAIISHADSLMYKNKVTKPNH